MNRLQSDSVTNLFSRNANISFVVLLKPQSSTSAVYHCLNSLNEHNSTEKRETSFQADNCVQNGRFLHRCCEPTQVNRPVSLLSLSLKGVNNSTTDGFLPPGRVRCLRFFSPDQIAMEKEQAVQESLGFFHTAIGDSLPCPQM